MIEKYQVCAPLSEGEREALKASIAEHGVRVPVEVDEEGHILDGYNRFEIARELGVPCPVSVKAGLETDEAKRAYARQMNTARRQITDEGRKEMTQQQLRETSHWANRRIARVTGVHVDTCQKWREEMIHAGEIPFYEKLEGEDGKAYPAKQPRHGWMYKPDWENWHRMEALSHLREVDEGCKEALDEIMGGRQRHPKDALTMLQTAARFSDRDKKRFLELWQSGDSRRRSLVVSRLVGTEPPTDPSLGPTMQAMQELQRVAESRNGDGSELSQAVERIRSFVRRVQAEQEVW